MTCTWTHHEVPPYVKLWESPQKDIRLYQRLSAKLFYDVTNYKPSRWRIANEIYSATELCLRSVIPSTIYWKCYISQHIAASVTPMGWVQTGSPLVFGPYVVLISSVSCLPTKWLHLLCCEFQVWIPGFLILNLFTFSVAPFFEYIYRCFICSAVCSGHVAVIKFSHTLKRLCCRAPVRWSGNYRGWQRRKRCFVPELRASERQVGLLCVTLPSRFHPPLLHFPL